MKIFDAAAANIEWNTTDERVVTDLTVYDVTTKSEAELHKLGQRFISSHGTYNSDWLDEKRAASTPEGVFMDWLINGFASPEVMLDALDQLGQLKEAGWARTMAKAFREIMIQREGGEEDAKERWAGPTYEGL